MRHERPCKLGRIIAPDAASVKEMIRKELADRSDYPKNRIIARGL
jgi:hypothetical protein